MEIVDSVRRKHRSIEDRCMKVLEGKPSASPEEQIVKLTKDEIKFYFALLSYHPDWDTKSVGVKSFTFGPHSQLQGSTFYAILLDYGDRHDTFSLKKILAMMRSNVNAVGMNKNKENQFVLRESGRTKGPSPASHDSVEALRSRLAKASTATELSTALAKASIDSIRAQHNRISDRCRKAWDATSRTKLDYVELSEDEIKFYFALLPHHPNWDTKRIGLESFTFGPKGKNVGVLLEYGDRKDTFSINKILKTVRRSRELVRESESEAADSAPHSHGVEKPKNEGKATSADSKPFSDTPVDASGAAPCATAAEERGPETERTTPTVFEKFKHLIEIREIDLAAERKVRTQFRWHVVSDTPDYADTVDATIPYDFSRLEDDDRECVWDDDADELYQSDVKQKLLRVEVEYLGSTPVAFDRRQWKQLLDVDFIMLKNNKSERDEYVVPDIYQTGESADLFLESLDRFLVEDVADVLSVGETKSEAAPFKIADGVFRHGAVLFGTSLRDVRKVVSPQLVTKSLSSTAYRKGKERVTHKDHYRKKNVVLCHHHQPFLQVAAFPNTVGQNSSKTQRSDFLPSEILKFHKTLRQFHYTPIKFLKRWLKGLHERGVVRAEIMEKVQASDWNGFSLRLKDEALSQEAHMHGSFSSVARIFDGDNGVDFLSYPSSE